MLMRLRAPIVVLLLAAACGGNAPVSAPILLETPAPGHVRRIQQVEFEMKITGAETFSIKTKTHLRFEEIASHVPVSLWFLSVSAPTDALVTTKDGRELLFTADIAPGLYRGAGRTYVLGSSTQGPVLGVPTNLKSAAYIDVTTLTPKLATEHFDLANAKYEKPCSLAVGAQLHNGTLTCPKLSDASGHNVSLSWTWTWI